VTSAATGETPKPKRIPEDFDAALEEAKAEGNLSRDNVARKVKGCACGRGPRYRQGPPTVPPRVETTP
jgi:hypothetical protein